MKRGLLSIAAMIPLLVLTVDSFVELRGMTAETPAAENDPRYLEIQKLIDTARQNESNPEEQLAADAKLAHELGAGGLLEARLPAAVPSASTLHETADKWRKFDEARDFVLKAKKLRLLRTGSLRPPESETEADKEVKEIDDFNSQAARKALIDDFPPASELFGLVDARQAMLKAALDQFAERKRIAAAVARVREHFQNQRFDECLLALEQDELKNLSNSELTIEFVSLRHRAQFRVDGKKLLGSMTADPAGQDQLKSYEAFFLLHTAPPTEDERAQYTEIERRRDVVKINLLLEHLRPAPDVITLLTTAATICAAKHADPELKNRARTQVRQWLLSERGLAHKETPVFLQDGKKEAITKRGQRKLGFFSLPEGAAQTRFWETSAGYQNRVPPLGTERFGEGDLQQLPDTPQYMKWADEFNETSQQLVRGRSTRDQWEHFARRCAEMQTELVRYREKYGIKEEPDGSCRGWDFHAHATVAHDVVDHWEQYDEVQEN
jgi:hypothetical protein